MFADSGTGQHDSAISQPRPVSDGNGALGHRLLGDRPGHVAIVMILIGDVDMVTGPNVVADFDIEMSHDAAALSNQAAVTNFNYRVRDALLPRNHSGGKSDMGPDHGARSNVNELFVEQRVGGKANDAVLAERTKFPAPPAVRPDRGTFNGCFPTPVHKLAGGPLEQTPESISDARHLVGSVQHAGTIPVPTDVAALRNRSALVFAIREVDHRHRSCQTTESARKHVIVQ